MLAGSDAVDLQDLAQRGRDWLVRQALPLWLAAGFDSVHDAFEEQLNFDGTPVALPRRLMVQAWQIAVYVRMAVEGDFPAGRAPAIAAGHAMIARYLEADGAPGWVSAVDRDGRVVDPSRDLYAHAFALFALAWLRRVDDHPSIDRAIAATLGVLDAAFACVEHGGFWDALPRPDRLRRQNPHMHLFEALLELHEAGGDAAVAARCHRLDALARARFLVTADGPLCEEFADDWCVHPAPGRGSVEPGHQFEWAWLWRRYQTLLGEDRGALAGALIGRALATGVDAARGRIVDEVGEDGAARRSTSRSWPHAEAAKALAVEIARGRTDLVPVYRAVYDRLLTVYCPPQLGGGWMDRVGVADEGLSRTMPASSLYHLSFGLKSIDALVPRP